MKKILTFCLLVCLGLTIQIIKAWPDDNLHVIFCDVGQGDAILLKHGFWQMLIDAGPDDKVLACLNQHIPWWDRHLEVVMITHPHLDHYGGLPDVLDNFQIHNLFLTDVEDSQEFKNLLFALKKNISSTAVYRNGILGRKIKFSSGGELTFLAPDHSQINAVNANLVEFSETMLSDVNRSNYAAAGDLNERSIVLLLQYYEFDLLLMGDAVVSNELALMEQGLIKPAEGLKVGHHGSKTSSGKPFIQKIQPEFSVISCAQKNKFNHPSLEVIQTLQDNFSQIWRTDEQGTIHLTTNGRFYWLFK